MKKVWKVLLIVLAALILVIVGAVGVNRIVYGRSTMATIAELVVRSGTSKTIFTDESALDEFVEQKRISNQNEYEFPENVSLDVTVEQYQSGGMQVFLFNPESSADQTVVYWHGGAYINQPSAEHLRFLNRLAKELDISIYLPIYPKLPQYTYEDAYAAAMEFYEELCGKGYKEISFMGDSAGGGFALGFAIELAKTDLFQPDQLILFSPWVDVSMENVEMEKYEKADPMLGIYGLKVLGTMWSGEDLDVHDPKVSPVYGDLTDLGHITLFVGTREIFYPEILRLDEALTQQGVAHTLHVGNGMNHVYPVYPIPEADDVFDEVTELIRTGA